MYEFPPTGFISETSKVEGILVFKPAPINEPGEKAEVEFKCPQCGATTVYNVAEQSLICQHCGYIDPAVNREIGKNAGEQEFTLNVLDEANQGWGEERKEMGCGQCGGVVSVPVENLSHTCPFCGSNKVIQRLDQQNSLRPRFLIPFGIVPEACQRITREWLSSSWMTPAGLSQIASLKRFVALYLPFWTFDALNTANWRAEVGHTKTERYYQDGEWKERTVLVWRWENGEVRIRVDDLLIPGSTHVSHALLRKISTYNLHALVPYEARYLAGLQAQAFTLNLEKAWELARQEMREKIKQACMEQASTQQIRNFRMDLDFADESWRYILLPVYISAFSYQGMTFQVMVNGQSGVIAGQRPVDWTKFWLVMAAILSPGILLGLLGLITIPLAGIGSILAVGGFILFIIGLVIVFVFFNQAQAMDDA